MPFMKQEQELVGLRKRREDASPSAAQGSIAPCVNCYVFTGGKCTRVASLERKCKGNNYHYFVQKPAAEQFGDAVAEAIDVCPELKAQLVDKGLVTIKGKQ